MTDIEPPRSTWRCFNLVGAVVAGKRAAEEQLQEDSKKEWAVDYSAP